MSESLWKFMRENELRIENDVSKKLQCNICNKLMTKACNAPCGCRFCSDCIEHYLDGKNKFCPGTTRYCQNRMINYANDIAIDRPINIRISEIVVNCPRQNCEFNDELQMIENHMRTCDKQSISCPFNAIGCEMNEIRNEEMKSHLNQEIYCHSKMLIELINNLRNEMESMKSENTEMRNDNIELRNENKQFKQQIERQIANHQQKMCEMEAKEQENTGEIEEIKEEIKAVKIENRASQDEMIELMNEIIQSKQQIKNIEKPIETSETKSERQIDAFKQISEQQQLQQNIKIQNEMKTLKRISKRVKQNYTQYNPN